ncbi:hypothetical protein ACOI1H_14765 [Loktanella sp. DJP18]|uniref:hypothetical protein n=1 Tax=Loktanella sp. DJP18 TaxID=3409788 RepID=UPI003BB6EC93
MADLKSLEIALIASLENAVLPAPTADIEACDSDLFADVMSDADIAAAEDEGLSSFL